MKRFMLSLGMLCLFSNLLLSPACNDDDDTDAMPNMVEFVSDDPDLSILRDAIIRANLSGILSGAGPFTLFAPDNAAFQALLASNPDWNTLDDIPVDVLGSVLTYHVIAGQFNSGDLQTAYYSTLSATSFDQDAGVSVYVDVDGGVTLNGGPGVSDPDIEVSNGVIHKIDAVIELPTIVTFATTNPSFSSLVAALTADGLTTDFVEVLSGDGPFTVFAPTNEAFQDLLDSNPDWNTISDIPAATLETVLRYHVTDVGNVRSEDLMDGMTVGTLAEGQNFTIDLSGATPAIQAGSNTAEIVVTDVQAANGVVHVIDTVILP